MTNQWLVSSILLLFLFAVAAMVADNPLQGASPYPVSFNQRGENWRPTYSENGGTPSRNSTAGVTYFWGIHQVGESVLAFGKDQFTAQQPRNVFRTISYQNSQCRISYLEVFVRNAEVDQVYLSHGGIGTSFIGVYIGSKTPTTHFEYKATLYGFE